MYVSRRLRLCSLGADDLSTFFAWRNEVEFLNLVANNPEPVSYEKFLKEQDRRTRGCDCLFVVKRHHENMPVGVVYSLNTNLYDRFTFVNVYIGGSYRDLGLGAEAGILLIHHLFRTLSLHKVYLDALESNQQSLSMYKTAGLAQEAYLVGHRWVSGSRQSVYRFAVYQADIERLARMVRVRETAE